MVFLWLIHCVYASFSQAFSDFMLETTWRQKTPYILLLPLLLLHIKKRKYCAVAWIKSYYLLGLILNVFIAT